MVSAVRRSDIFRGVDACLDGERKGRTTVESLTNAEVRITVSGMTLVERAKVEAWLAANMPVVVVWTLCDEKGPLVYGPPIGPRAKDDGKEFARRFQAHLKGQGTC